MWECTLIQTWGLQVGSGWRELVVSQGDEQNRVAQQGIPALVLMVSEYGTECIANGMKYNLSRTEQVNAWQQPIMLNCLALIV